MATQDFAARLDRVPVSRFHRKLLLLSGLGWMFDAMDILLVGSVVAAVSRTWELDAATAAWINSVNLLGLFVGASLAGTLSDRIGRKAMFQATLLVYSVFTGLSALAFNAASLMVLRFLAGIGLGGELPVASTLLAEFAPARRRGAMVVLLESFWAYGAVLAALIGYLVIPRFGWQAAFLIGALPALYVFILRREMPESPRFLVSRGRVAEAEEIVRAVEARSGVRSDPAARPIPAAAFGRLWGILAPLSISVQVALFGSDITVFLVFTAVMVVGALIVLALGEETRGLSLEQIAGA